MTANQILSIQIALVGGVCIVTLRDWWRNRGWVKTADCRLVFTPYQPCASYRYRALEYWWLNAKTCQGEWRPSEFGKPELEKVSP